VVSIAFVQIVFSQDSQEQILWEIEQVLKEGKRNIWA